MSEIGAPATLAHPQHVAFCDGSYIHGVSVARRGVAQGPAYPSTVNRHSAFPHKTLREVVHSTAVYIVVWWHSAPKMPS
jgi:hypothetical protein